MAYGAELAGAGASVQFIYVWPSRELIERSWSWPASWHEAFQDAASRIGLSVAIYLLEGSRLSRQLISLQLSIGFTKFRVKRRGTSIVITVVEFTGPYVPGPDTPGPDGARQPCAVDGLVLGLHGSGKNAYLVVFHGKLPIPAGEHPSRLPMDRICRPIDPQLPMVRLTASKNQRDDARFSDRIAEPGESARESGTGILRFSPVLHFRLVAGRPIYVARPLGSPEQPNMPHALGRAEDGDPRRRSASAAKKEILLSDGIKLPLNKGASSEPRLNSESRLKMEKSPFKHLRSRYLH
jgi:hypothetical protein